MDQDLMQHFRRIFRKHAVWAVMIAFGPLTYAQDQESVPGQEKSPQQEVDATIGQEQATDASLEQAKQEIANLNLSIPPRWKELEFHQAVKLLTRTAGTSPEVTAFRDELVDHLASLGGLSKHTRQQGFELIEFIDGLDHFKDSKEAIKLRERIADAAIRRRIAESKPLTSENTKYLSSLSDYASAEAVREILAWAHHQMDRHDQWLATRPENSSWIACKIQRIIINHDDASDRLVSEFDHMLIDAVFVDPITLPPPLTLNDTTVFHHGYAVMWRRGKNVVGFLSDEGRVKLRKRLLQQDDPSALAMMVAVQAYRAKDPEELLALGAYFQEKADAAEGDLRARWLMARAYAAEAETQPTWSVLHGRRYLDQALKVAKSDSVKRDIVRWLVQGEAALGKPGKARALLKKHEALYLVDQETIAKHLELERQVDAAEEGRRRWVQRQVDYETEQRQQAILRGLEKARTKGSQDQVERYERLLKQFEK